MSSPCIASILRTCTTWWSGHTSQRVMAGGIVWSRRLARNPLTSHVNRSKGKYSRNQFDLCPHPLLCDSDINLSHIQMVQSFYWMTGPNFRPFRESGDGSQPWARWSTDCKATGKRDTKRREMEWNKEVGPFTIRSESTHIDKTLIAYI